MPNFNSNPSNLDRRLARLEQHHRPDPDLLRQCRDAVATYLRLLWTLDLPDGWVDERVARLPAERSPLDRTRAAYDLLMDGLRNQV